MTSLVDDDFGDDLDPPEPQRPHEKLLADAKRNIALAEGSLAKLKALAAGAATLAMPVKHGFIERQQVVDELYEQAGNCGMHEDPGEIPVIKTIARALNEGVADEMNGHSLTEPPQAESPDDYGARGGEQRASSSPGRFLPVAIDDVEASAGPAWLIDRVIPARGLVCIVGPPKSRKSFLTTDLTFSVARDAPYGGRAVLQGLVIYCTGEGVQDFKRCLIAMRRHYGVEGKGVPFFMIENVPDLGSEKTDVGDLLRDLDAFISAHNLPAPRAIVFDTLARCIGEGDENSAKDMGRFVNRCSLVERHFGCVVVVVHHMGKNPAAGGRGSNALNGAVDVTLTIEKGETYSTVRIDEMKDGPEGQEWRFRLAPYDLGETSATAETSTETSTCTVELLSEPTQTKPRETTAAKPPRGVTGDLLLVIRRALAEMGAANVASAAVPNNVRAVSRANLKNYCTTMDWQDPIGKPDAFRTMLNKSLSSLRSSVLIGYDREWVWLT